MNSFGSRLPLPALSHLQLAHEIDDELRIDDEIKHAAASRTRVASLRCDFALKRMRDHAKFFGNRSVADERRRGCNGFEDRLQSAFGEESFSRYDLHEDVESAQQLA